MLNPSFLGFKNTTIKHIIDDLINAGNIYKWVY